MRITCHFIPAEKFPSIKDLIYSGLGDTGKQTLVKYTTTNPKCIQNDQGYVSRKLKKMKIEGL
jgi:hypothetical protein